MHWLCYHQAHLSPWQTQMGPLDPLRRQPLQKGGEVCRHRGLDRKAFGRLWVGQLQLRGVEAHAGLMQWGVK